MARLIRHWACCYVDGILRGTTAAVTGFYLCARKHPLKIIRDIILKTTISNYFSCQNNMNFMGVKQAI